MSAPVRSGVPPGPPPGGPTIPGPPPGGPMYGQGAYPGFPGIPPPPVLPSFPPPLPPGWSEHAAPDGVTKYYYNSETKQSTYKRPMIAPPTIPAAAAPAPAPEGKKKKEKKERAKTKVPIPGTAWLRVTTNTGGVFYFESEARRSEWTVPEEIAEAVAAFDAAEKAEKQAKAEEERLERLREQERVRAEVKAEHQRKAEERKRKAGEGKEDKEVPKKKAKKSEGEEKKAKEGWAEDDGAPAEDEDAYAGGQGEAWRQAIAAEFAEVDATKAAEEADAEEREKKAEQEAAKKVFAAENVNVSPEEARALFKALLMDKNISPFAPWEQSLPLFITDPRYVLVPTEKARREVYEEYCRDAGRQRRMAKPEASAPAAAAKADPERDYRALMREVVTSTRTRFDDFKRKNKKDRRFYSYGRDDREREKSFKVHLRELGERKRADAARAEADFNELLLETPGITGTSEWAEVKRGIASDARYDAVGSSTLRGELFAAFIAKLSATSEPETPEQAAERKARERKERQAASLLEREGQVRDLNVKVSEDVERSRASAGREEGERLFGSLLVDVVRSHEQTWDSMLPILQQDRRFAHPSLRTGDKRRVFDEHVGRLGANKADALNKVFAAAAPELHTSYEDAYAALADDPLVLRLGLVGSALQERFGAWRRAREADARREFDALLAENRFVDFWGRMRNKAVDGAAAAVDEQEERDKGQGVHDGGDADMVALAQRMDLSEIKTILRRDRRYRQFDHMPEVRERWLREHLESMEGTKGAETVHKVG